VAALLVELVGSDTPAQLVQLIVENAPERRPEILAVLDRTSDGISVLGAVWPSACH